jgi:two-component system NtrC family response regulator
MNDTEKPTILLVEDDAPQRKVLSGFLEKRGYRVIGVDSATAAMSAAASEPPNLLLTDLRLGGPDGVELLSALREQHSDIEAVVLTAYGTVDDAVRAMRAGAYDFISKPVDLQRLETLIEKALEKSNLSREVRDLRETVKNSGAFLDLIGDSAAIQKIVHQAAKAASSKASVLILGESGTGKEVLARGIHLASPRRSKPFLTVNCAALPETLIESELFGHEKGAFTGAAAKKKGRFELAHQGTLFLDEVGEIPLQVQVKLLNVLQSGKFERVGGTETIATDVRIIAATNRDLKAQAGNGTFREDLFFRLNVVAFTLPPLRDRREDITLLISYFLQKQADILGTSPLVVSDRAMQQLLRYSFPGNIRELENLIERAVVFSDGKTLTEDDLPESLSKKTDSLTSPSEQGLEAQVAALEISMIRDALQRNAGNQSAAARELCITERNIRYKIKKYGL